MNTKKVSDLFAFWRYDLFPYVLGGQVSGMDDKGLVYISSYQRWFNPIKLLPTDTGKKVSQELRQLELEYSQAKDKLLKEYEDKLEKIMPESIIRKAK